MILLAVPALAAAAYYLLAIVAALRWPKQTEDRPAATPPISLLKPMYGSDPRLYQALRSHAVQDYPEFEMLFGVSDSSDPALKEIDRLQREFPSLAMRVIPVETDAPNPKVMVLAALAQQARYPVLVVNDDDIEVEPDYFRRVVAPLADPKTGLVTCLYRAHADSLAACAEALGIATEFVPSVLVARMVGVVEFALGATMAIRVETLRKIGGFEPIASYLADDYQLGRRVTKAGCRVEFAPAIVETGLGAVSWKQAWRHQLRWARTIRISRSAGFYGSLVTHGTIWALVAFAAGEWWAGAFAMAMRLLAGWIAGAVILKDRIVKRWFWLMPLRDLFGFAVWLGGCFGSTVYWRGRKLRLAADGSINATGPTN
ncbi:MAG TPA: bacteriohopanetetrol glucosamine biosynthesis glycosyltransferase HpnI [Bryobacteraceae bacterium]|nr:bacteriohopanetetrol glucosamine biosynthesis glycosyltransferase HpnI [Bryobacteraceae bacterium]